MLDLLVQYIKTKLIYDAVNLLLYGGGLLAVLKVSLWFYSQRLYSFYWVYRHKNRFMNHPIFEKIEHLKNRNDVALSVLDHTKKVIVSELFYIEISKIHQVLKMSLKHLYRADFVSYLQSFGEFKSGKIARYFLDEYMNSMSARKRRARNEFTRLGMSEEHFERLWLLYSEILGDYGIHLTKRFESYETQTDVYRTLNTILNDFNILIEDMSESMGGKFNRLNGRSYGISYRGKAIGDHNNAE